MLRLVADEKEEEEHPGSLAPACLGAIFPRAPGGGGRIEPGVGAPQARQPRVDDPHGSRAPAGATGAALGVSPGPPPAAGLTPPGSPVAPAGAREIFGVLLPGVSATLRPRALFCRPWRG